MKRLIYFVIIFEIALTACSGSFTQKDSENSMVTENPQTSIQNKTDNQNKPKPETVNRPAGFPDFENFKYPKSCIEGLSGPFKLKDGVFKYPKEYGYELELVREKYADVTNDGREEALVVLSIITTGTMKPRCVYIFELDQKTKKVKLLWDFQTGDRADGGLRRIYGENGNLVLEVYSPGNQTGACCPEYYLKQTYKWEGGKFRKQSEEQFVNPDRVAVLLD